MAERDKKRELAQQLYLYTSMDQKEICAKVGWTEATFTKNKQKYKWEELKAAYTLTRESVIRNLYQQVNLITETANQEKRALTAKECDQIAKLSNAIEKLNRKESLSSYIQVFDTFSKWLLKVNAKLAREVIGYQDDFIGIKVNELT